MMLFKLSLYLKKKIALIKKKCMYNNNNNKVG